MDSNNTPPNIIDQLKAYAETRFKLMKYEAIEKGTSVAAEIIADAAIIIFLFFGFIFASLTLGFFIAQVLKSNWAGFGCVAALYLLIGVLIIVFKKRIEAPVINSLIKKLMK